MIPQLSGASIRQAMRWTGDEGRLANACGTVLEFMHRHPVAATWRRSDLASSDMMSTCAIGGVSPYAQPIVIHDRQAGAAIEGVVRDVRPKTSQLAVDTHGDTDFAMALAKLLGFDLCPRSKALKERQFFVPMGTPIPEPVRAICRANVDLAKVTALGTSCFE